MPRASRRPRAETLTVGVFCGPWNTGQASPDGAILGFADVEHALNAALSGNPQFNLVELDLALFVADFPAPQFDGIDVVYANCGPLAALLFHLREKHRLRFAIIREVRTLGWIGYAFQEYIAARSEHAAGDLCVHVSRYSQALWRTFRPQSHDLFFYPLLRARRNRPQRCASDAALRCGFFSRISADKGLAYLPAIFERLLAAGWPIRELVACGVLEDAGLLEHCRRKLAGLGIALTYRGPLAHSEALAQVAAVDAIIFPSVSSFEAGGRVVLEAYQLGKPVIASDYCAARDVLQPEYRIPLLLNGTTSGSGAHAFPIAQLALENWCAPPWAPGGFIEEHCARFRYHEDDVLNLLSAPRAPATRPAHPEKAPRMMWHWEETDRRSPAAWSEEIRQALAATCRDRRDLLDLGGAFKRSLLATGFDPQVSFYFDAPTSERNSSNFPLRN